MNFGDPSVRTRPLGPLRAQAPEPGLGEDLVAVPLVVAPRSLTLLGGRAVAVPLAPVPHVPGPVDRLAVGRVLDPLVGPGLDSLAVPPPVLPIARALGLEATSGGAVPGPPASSERARERPLALRTTRRAGHPAPSRQALFSAQFVHLPDLDRRHPPSRGFDPGRRCVRACANTSGAAALPTFPAARSDGSSPHPPPAPVGGGSAFSACNLPPGWDRPQATGPPGTTHVGHAAPGPRSPGARPGSPSMPRPGSGPSRTASRAPPPWDDVLALPPRRPTNCLPSAVHHAILPS